MLIGSKSPTFSADLSFHFWIPLSSTTYMIWWFQYTAPIYVSKCWLCSSHVKVLDDKSFYTTHMGPSLLHFIQRGSASQSWCMQVYIFALRIFEITRGRMRERYTKQKHLQPPDWARKSDHCRSKLKKRKETYTGQYSKQDSVCVSRM